MDFMSIEALVRSTLDGHPDVAITSEVSDEGDLVLRLTCLGGLSDRQLVRWVVYRGFEVFSFDFDEFRAIDFDYDIEPGDKAELVVKWVRLSEAYLRGAGSSVQRRTLVRRRTFRQLTVVAGEHNWVLSSRPTKARR